MEHVEESDPSCSMNWSDKLYLPDNTRVTTKIVCAVLLNTVPQFDQPVTTPCSQQSGRGVKLH